LAPRGKPKIKKKERKKERKKNGALLEKQSKTKTNALFQHCERTY
jgi:hypothetical protein